MPFQKLIVENFECHEYRKINLQKRNVIIGNNDIGKSALIRALHWVCFNTRNFSFKNDVRHGAKFCRVVLYVDDHKIERYRSKSKNHYLLDGKKYKAIGHKVPSVIAEILNLGDYNFQMQLDLPFWVSETPGKVSKKLNEVVDLDIMDRAIKEVSTMSKQAKYDLNAVRSLKEDQQKVSFEGLDSLKDSLDVFIKINTRHERLLKELKLLSKARSEIREESSKQNKLFRLVLQMTDCLKLAKTVRLYTEQLRTLNNCSIDLEKTSRIALFASGCLDRVYVALNTLERSNTILDRFTAITIPISEEHEIQTMCRKEIEECLQSLKGKKCPVCQNKIT